MPYSFFFRELDFFEALLALFVSDALGIGTVKRVTVASGKTAVALREAVARGDRDTYVRPANAGALLKAH